MSEVSLLPANAGNDQQKVAIKEFEGLMTSYQDHVNKLVQSKGIDPAEFMMSIFNGVRREPKLLECETKSVIGAFLMAAELGLHPNTPHQLSFVLPYNVNVGTASNKKYEKQAQFQIGYQGWVEIFGRNSKIEWVTAELVFENDEFVQKKFPKPELIHNPTAGVRGERIGTYAVAKLKGSDILLWIYVNKEEVEKIKAKSQGGGIAWKEENDPLGWMWRKCAIKQIAKILPKTEDLRMAVYAQNMEDVGKPITAADDGRIQLEPVTTEEERNREATDQKNDDIDKAAGAMFGNDTPNIQKQD